MMTTAEYLEIDPPVTWTPKETVALVTEEPPCVQVVEPLDSEISQQLFPEPCEQLNTLAAHIDVEPKKLLDTNPDGQEVLLELEDKASEDAQMKRTPRSYPQIDYRLQSATFKAPEFYTSPVSPPFKAAEITAMEPIPLVKRKRGRPRKSAPPSDAVVVPKSPSVVKRRRRSAQILDPIEGSDIEAATRAQLPKSVRIDLEGIKENAINQAVLKLKEQSLKFPPCVFQCKRCFKIVADSMSLLCSEEYFYVFYQSATAAEDDNFLIAEGLLNQDNESAFDFMTVFSEIFCRSCKCVLGKFYLSTPSKLHHLTKHYCIDKDAVSCYYLGSKHVDATNKKVDEVSTLVSLQHDVLKLQKMVLFLYASATKKH